MADIEPNALSSIRFAARFALRPEQFAWFLGAGTSASAGIPTGYMMIRDFKTRLFCIETGLSRREVDPADPLWIERVDNFFKKRAILPSPGDPAEYSAAFEILFPEESDRRRYIEDAIRLGTPSFGHRALAALITTRRIPCIFTTNFDPLLESAVNQTDLLLEAGDRAWPTVAALDSVERAERCARELSWPLIVKLHGDYKSTKLKNTAIELKEQDDRLRAVLTGVCQRLGLVVVGYSGRDASVMEALEQSLKVPGAFPGGIYWVARSQGELLPAVRDFLKKADDAGLASVVVESHNFDELAADLANQFDFPSVLNKHVFGARSTPALRPVPIPKDEVLRFPVLRCSALLLEQFPLRARRLTLRSSASTVTVRALLREANVRAVVASTGSEVAAFGPDEGLVSALASLGAKVNGMIKLEPNVSSWALGLLYDALTRALCRDRPLFPRMRRSGHAVLIARREPSEDNAYFEKLSRLKAAYESTLIGTVPELGYAYNEGVRLRLEYCVERWWCLFDPFTFVEVPRSEEVVVVEGSGDSVMTDLFKEDPAADWRRERWARKYNYAWTRIIDAWAHLLASSNDQLLRAYDIPEEVGVDAEFSLSNVTAWSRPAHFHSYFERKS